MSGLAAFLAELDSVSWNRQRLAVRHDARKICWPILVHMGSQFVLHMGLLVR